MKVIIDIEANGLKKPTQIWLIVCKDIDTGELHVFREPTQHVEEAARFLEFSISVDLWVGHNLLGYDAIVLRDLLGWTIPDPGIRTFDTLIGSKLSNYSREAGHSLESYGVEFGIKKGDFTDFSKYSIELEEYCIRDVDITYILYNKLKYLLELNWKDSVQLEHQFQLLCNKMEDNGFYFNKKKAIDLLTKVEEQLSILDKDILNTFLPKELFLRNIRTNKDGSINKVDLRYYELPSTSDIFVRNGEIFRREVFNPSSHKQIIDVLHEAGWKPVDKTKAHIELLREKVVDKEKEIHYAKYGWKVNEANLGTLPTRAPQPARTLAKRILYEARRRSLVEWLSLVADDGRIHGDFRAIGTWPHRMSHQHPNMANIPNEKDNQGRIKLLGGELRSLWCAPKNRLLVGCDAEGIQLRGFAHYIDDKEFTDAIVNGRKKDKTDPHSVNQRILGRVCKDRQAAKRFIYALFFGAGLSKLGEILEASEHETKSALGRLMDRYQGFVYLKKHHIPADAERGYFIGLDGRLVQIPSDDPRYRAHLCLSGYLQNFEKVIMAKATVLWTSELDRAGIDYLLVDLVHDEWQTECRNNMDDAILIGRTQCNSLKTAGEYYKTKCPTAGSFWNDYKNDYTIGTNWRVTH